MSHARPLRALFLANDGASVGHVTRAVAVARALQAAARRGGGDAQVLLATTSTADGLLAWSGVPAVRIPPPGAKGIPETERRALAERVLDGALAGFAPDVLVVDTFPCGPQLEAWPLLRSATKKVLVRRTVRPERERDAVLRSGIESYDRIVVPDDPMPLDIPGEDARHVRVRPIVMLPESEVLSHEDARAALNESGEIRDWADDTVLICNVSAMTHRPGDRHVDAGGTRDVADSIRAGLMRCSQAPYVPALTSADKGWSPLQRVIRGFQCALIPGGYNTTHECAAAGVPSIIFPRPRDFDDQAARADRFEAGGLGIRLRSLERDEIVGAVRRVQTTRFAPLRCTGADETARVILELCGAAKPGGRA
jgi:predicted glycosyltransferase